MNTTKKSAPVVHSVHEKAFYIEALSMFAFWVADYSLSMEELMKQVFATYHTGGDLDELADRIFNIVDPEAEDDHAEEHKRGEWGNHWDCDTDFHYDSDGEARYMWQSLFQEASVKLCRLRGITKEKVSDDDLYDLSSKAITDHGTLECVVKAASQQAGLTYAAPINSHAFTLEIIEKCSPLIQSFSVNRGDILWEIDKFMEEDSIEDFINSCEKCFKSLEPCGCNTYMEQIIENIHAVANN